jgi:hypothetical protein
MTFCANCDQMRRYTLDEAKRWECRSCGFPIECTTCGQQLSARHDCQST